MVLGKKHVLSKYQSGFRKNHTTFDHIIRLETDIRKGFKHRQSTTAVFLDISRAYDMVYKPALLKKIQKAGIRGHLAHYLIEFLSGVRTFRVRCRSVHSDTYTLQNGLPQGSCLSPMLFNIMINDIFDTIPAGISHSLFADDCAIWCTDRDSQHSIPRLQQALDRIENWSGKNGFIFSATKSAVMTFTKNTRMLQAADLYLSGHIIPRVPSFKFLGIVLDSRLGMAKHIEHVKSKCAKRMNLFRCIAGTEFGADRKTLLQLYKTLILPIIEYGAVIYAGASDNVLKKLDTIQNTFIRIAIGAMKTSPIPSLHVEAVMMPLPLRRMELSLRYISKIMYHPNHNTYTSLRVLPSIHHNYVGPAEKRSGLTIASRTKKFSDELEYIRPQIIPLPALKTPQWQRKEMDVVFLLECSKSQITPEEIQQKFLELRNRFSNSHFIYTDGSKDGDRTSNAVFCNCIILQTRLQNNTSIFIAELHAVLEALKHIREEKVQKAVICTDSRSVVQSLRKKDPSSPLLIHIHNIHHELSNTGTEIQFVWIPGHSGIYGNIQADKFAKEALALENITDIPVEFTSIKASLRQSTLTKWQQQWRNTTTATQLRCIKPKIELWSSSNRSNRREEKALARLRLGHTLYTHGHIYSGNDRPMCTRCQTVQTVQHIIINCPNHRIHRKKMIDFCNKESLAFGLPAVLGNTPELHDLLFSFLKETQLFDKI